MEECGIQRPLSNECKVTGEQIFLVLVQNKSRLIMYPGYLRHKLSNDGQFGDTGDIAKEVRWR